MKNNLELQSAFRQAEKILSAASVMTEAAPQLLQTCGNALGCQWGTLWLVDIEASSLRPVCMWSAEPTNTQELKKDTKNRSLSMSEGNAGHVWRSQKPIWSQDLVKDMCIPRSIDADRAGLHGGVWFALKTDKIVYGVLEFLGESLSNSSEDNLRLLENFGITLGKILERREKSHQG